MDRRRSIRWARRAVQLTVLAGLLLIPALGRYQALRNQRDEVGIRQEVLPRLLHEVLGDVRNPEPVTTLLRGSVWTFRVHDLVISDPLAGLDFAAATRNPFDPFLLTVVLPVLATLLLGRVFCGWICPADLLFEIGSGIRKFAGVETDVKFSRRTKFAVLGVGLLGSLLLGAQTLAEVYPPRLLSGELYSWVWYHRFGVGGWFLLVVLAFEIFVSKRFWCRYACPGGAVYVLLSRWRLVRLRIDRDACDACRDCEPVCEFGLKPEAKDVGPECNACGECLPVCHSSALDLGAGKVQV